MFGKKINFCFFKVIVADKTQNLRRLEAQRNELNAKGMYTYYIAYIEKCHKTL